MYLRDELSMRSIGGWFGVYFCLAIRENVITTLSRAHKQFATPAKTVFSIYAIDIITWKAKPRTRRNVICKVS